jgi:hypothetical protein
MFSFEFESQPLENWCGIHGEASEYKDIFERSVGNYRLS